MRKVDIKNIDIKVWTWKNDFQLWNHLRSLTQPEIKRKIPVKLIGIEYDRAKYEIESMEVVEYNTSTERNVMNVDDI